MSYKSMWQYVAVSTCAKYNVVANEVSYYYNIISTGVLLAYVATVVANLILHFKRVFFLASHNDYCMMPHEMSINGVYRGLTVVCLRRG